MNPNKTLPQIEQDYIAMRNRLIAKIILLVGGQQTKTVDISERVVAEPAWVLYGVEDDDIADYVVESAFIHEDGDLGLVIYHPAYGTTIVYLSEDAYLFDSVKWLVNLCFNICEALGLEPETETV